MGIFWVTFLVETAFSIPNKAVGVRKILVPLHAEPDSKKFKSVLTL